MVYNTTQLDIYCLIVYLAVYTYDFFTYLYVRTVHFFVVHGVISQITIFHAIILNTFFFGCLFDPFSLLCASMTPIMSLMTLIISPPSHLYVSEYIYLHIHVLFKPFMKRTQLFSNV
jgi:hypothetical protein